MKKTIRNESIDIYKGVAIFLVVLGHSIQCGTRFMFEESFFENSIFKFIYTFHMPIFMLISGYLFCSSTMKLSFTENLKHKFVHIGLPAMSSGIVWFLINEPSIISPYTFIKKIISYTFFSTWFLWAVMFNVFIVLFIHHYFKDNIWIYLSVIFVLLFLPNSYNIRYYTFMYPYFVLGYLFKRSNINTTILKFTPKKYHSWGILITICFILLLVLFKKQDYIYISGTSLVMPSTPYVNFKQLNIDIYRFLIGLCGSLSIMYILGIGIKCKKIYFPHLKSLFLKMGQNTLGIYTISTILSRLMSQLILKIVPFNVVNHLGIISALTETVLTILTTFFIISLFNKNKFTKLLFLGK